MSRRASLPGASELFRSTDASANSNNGHQSGGSGDRRSSGRQRHDSKITVYISDEELIALEHARLAVRARHGLVVDRGRVVREAVAVLLADFEENGEDSFLVKRLRLEHGR